jgi:hypothetical protein
MASSDLPDEARERLKGLEARRRALVDALANQSHELYRALERVHEAARALESTPLLQAHHGSEDRPGPPPVPQQPPVPGREPDEDASRYRGGAYWTPYDSPEWHLLMAAASERGGDEPMNRRLELTAQDWERARKAVRHTAPTLLLGTSKKALDQAARDLQGDAPAEPSAEAEAPVVLRHRLLLRSQSAPVDWLMRRAGAVLIAAAVGVTAAVALLANTEVTVITAISFAVAAAVAWSVLRK